MSVGYEVRIPTRWMDTDAYGHVNNAQYYSFFDTAVTTWLVSEAGMDAERDEAIAVCAESTCRFLAPVEFPATVTASVRVGKVGRSSVRYELDLRCREHPVAEGQFLHVYVDRESRRPVEIPAPVRARLDALTVAEAVTP
jgi:acyl-CoA thioester hydrolase